MLARKCQACRGEGDQAFGQIRALVRLWSTCCLSGCASQSRRGRAVQSVYIRRNPLFIFVWRNPAAAATSTLCIFAVLVIHPLALTTGFSWSWSFSSKFGTFKHTKYYPEYLNDNASPYVGVDNRHTRSRRVAGANKSMVEMDFSLTSQTTFKATQRHLWSTLFILSQPLRSP